MDALYCFCFAPSDLPADLDLDGCGWEDRVSVSRVVGLRVVLSRVPRERFEGDEAEQCLANLDWLLPRVAAHDRVIAQTMARSTVFPLPFGTLFSSTKALALEVASRRHSLLRFFERMAGREEWAVKALLDPERAIAARLRILYPDDAETPASGRGYLLRQRRKGLAEQALGPWLTQAVADLDQRLERHSEAVAVRPARDPAVANRAVLVDATGAAGLRAEVERIGAEYADQGLDLHCTGPWPLYSFCAAPPQ